MILIITLNTLQRVMVKVNSKKTSVATGFSDEIKYNKQGTSTTKFNISLISDVEGVR
jgi:hypothetical protein